MKKILLIGMKDLRLIFRDRAALILMLAAPFALTLGMGLVMGAFSGGGSGLAEVEISVVDEDEGLLGNVLVDVLTSKDLSLLLDTRILDQADLARQDVDEDRSSAAVIIPHGFSASNMPDPDSPETTEAIKIEVYTHPERPISSDVVLSIVEGFVNQVETGRVGGLVTVNQLVQSGRITPDEASTVGIEIGSRLANDLNATRLIQIQQENQAQAKEQSFSILYFLAPGMATLFLMYTVSLGSRSLLIERREGTLARLLTTPTSPGLVLVGKMVGTYLIGLAQVLILVFASALLLGLRWGNPLGLVVLLLVVVAGATGWGMLLAAFARTPGQVSSIGMAMMLVFGLVGGSFTGGAMPGALKYVSYLTPNSWAQLGFRSLARGGGVNDLSTNIAALLVMAVVLLVISVIIFRRRGILK